MKPEAGNKPAYQDTQLDYFFLICDHLYSLDNLNFNLVISKFDKLSAKNEIVFSDCQ